MARKNPLLPGYKALGGSARKYRTPSGETISRREYENRRLQGYGWKSWGEYQKAKRSDDWLRLEGIYTRAREIKRSTIGPTSEFALKSLATMRARDKVRNATSKKKIMQAEDELYDAEGPLADWLVYVGVRQPEDYWDVGDTPGANN